MNATEYQVAAARTLIVNPGEFSKSDLMVVWNAIGLAGEAGEVAELVKKGVFHRHEIDTGKLFKELGDVLWYVACMCTCLGMDLGEVMQGNIDKLKERYPNGFSHAESLNRKDLMP